MSPYITANQPGIGGQLKSNPEDFFVEEIPLYPPTGEGSHIYTKIEKRGLSTYAAIKIIARALKVSPRSIGYAGLKDAHAVTRQTMSIQAVPLEAVKALQLPNIQILEAFPHRNKLKIGHLAGNRFVIRVRHVNQSVMSTVEKILEILTTRGVPNFFGEQRFGNRANTHRLGEMLIRRNAAEFVAEYLGRPQANEAELVRAARQKVDAGQWAEALAHWPDYLPDERRVLAAIVRAEGRLDVAFRTVDRKLSNLFISAFQAHLFNKLLAKRLDFIDQLETGDAAYLHRNGAAFIVKDVETEQRRADNFEISPSGPIFGPKLLFAEGTPGEREKKILREQNLSLDDFKVTGLRARGLRRPYRFELKQAKIWWDEGLMISFELPPGAYATTVMAEIMKD